MSSSRFKSSHKSRRWAIRTLPSFLGISCEEDFYDANLGDLLLLR